MNYANGYAASANGIQELAFGEIDAVGGAAGAWEDLGPAVFGGMVGGAVGGATAGIFAGPEGAGIGAVGGAIGGGISAILTWYTTREK